MSVKRDSAGGEPAGASRNDFLQPPPPLSDPAEAERYQRNLDVLWIVLIGLAALAYIIVNHVL
jgi:hypothetical protein